MEICKKPQISTTLLNDSLRQKARPLSIFSFEIAASVVWRRSVRLPRQKMVRVKSEKKKYLRVYLYE